MGRRHISYLAMFKRPRVLIPTFLLLLTVSGVVCYRILLSPDSIFLRWAKAAMPEQITMISLGPYPEEKDFQHLKEAGVKYIVSVLDPRLPYEKDLIDREKLLADKYGLALELFPMASIFDRKIFPDYEEQQANAVYFLKNLDGPAYLHCYLGKHRIINIRDALIKAGLPERYLTPAASTREYWELLTTIDRAREEFHRDNFARVLEILAPVTAKDVDVTYLRGWSHYHLGLIEEATEDFRQGLEADPSNQRNLIGLGYCYLRNEQLVMAQRQFAVVLEQIPDDREALVGMGLAHLRLQNKAAAAQLFRKVLAANPGNKEAGRYLKEAESR